MTQLVTSSMKIPIADKAEEAQYRPIPIADPIISVTIIYYIHVRMVLDTDNLPFSADMPHRFSAGSRAAIRWRPRGNTRIASATMRGLSADLYNRPQMIAEAYVLD